MNNLSWQVGNVKVTQIIELDKCEGLQEAIPNAPPENLLKIPWLESNFIDENGKLKSQISSFIVESMGSTILVDTGVGNSKFRKDFPFWSNLKTDFLERLKQSFPNINFLISTHLLFIFSTNLNLKVFHRLIISEFFGVGGFRMIN